MPPMPTPTMPGRAGLAAGADDRVDHEALDRLHAVGRHEHLQEAHVLRPRSLGHALHVQAVPVGDELPVDVRDAVAGVVAGRLPRQGCGRCRAQRVLQRRAPRALAQGILDPHRVEREALADADVEDGDAGVLADQVAVLSATETLVLIVSRMRRADLVRLVLHRVLERVAQILGDVLERPHVQVGGGILDGGLRDRLRRRCSCGRRPSRPAAEDDAVEQRVAHHPVAPVHAARDLAGGEEALHAWSGRRVRCAGRRSGSGARGRSGSVRAGGRPPPRGSAAAWLGSRRPRPPRRSGLCPGAPPGARPAWSGRGPPRTRARSPRRPCRAARARRTNRSPAALRRVAP